MSITLSFHGGAGGVTGSCHLLSAGGLNILIDCGFFQGGFETEQRNRGDFGFDPASIDYLLLTHGHLDHCGRIPLLVKNGFRGKIICTSATYDIAKIIMLDTAKIQEEDSEHWQKISKRKGLEPPEPLHTTLDALDALRYFGDFAEYGETVRLNNQISVTFRDAGHIIGASFLEIEAGKEKRIVFSGDLGNRNKPIIKDPQYPQKADICVIEGTYSDRKHKDVETSVTELREAIIETFARGGNVLIPSFAIERAQDLLFYLGHMYYENELPNGKVFLDSPMAIGVNDIMRRHPECFDEETNTLLRNNHDPLSFPGLHLTKTPDDSRKINYTGSHAIIIAGSGMCTGGRIKHHLKHNIWRKESSIIFVGYQAEGSLGRQIVDGEKTVKIFDESFRVRAKVYTIGGFSAHADRDILLDWLKRCENPEHLFLVHGEKQALTSFEKDIRKDNLAREIHTPNLNQSYTL
ncbi:MAG: MBL fold metallo-hydrolase [Nitrospirae bacterium]|nr:MBL fold metallo-hydrolase [Nitrospirota bacterium]